MADTKRWQDRRGPGVVTLNAMELEIADLRAALGQRTATAVQMPDIWPLIDSYADAREEYSRSTARHLAKQQRENVEDAKAAVVAALDARAEEARREGYEQGRFDEQMAQGPSREEWARIDAEKDGRPVAEAAAQADDAPTMECPQCGVDRLKEPCPGMADECAMRADAHLLAPAAAPTAQPTTQEIRAVAPAQPTPIKNPADAESAEGGTVWEGIVAQPTPPDDELAMLDAQQKFLDWNRASTGELVRTGSEYAVFQKAIEFARAALRQPGALPVSVRTLIADDSYAMSFQSMGQYRTALLNAIGAQPNVDQDAARFVDFITSVLEVERSVDSWSVLTCEIIDQMSERKPTTIAQVREAIDAARAAAKQAGKEA